VDATRFGVSPRFSWTLQFAATLTSRNGQTLLLADNIQVVVEKGCRLIVAQAVTQEAQTGKYYAPGLGERVTTV